jgi:hypothetical protein
MKAPGETLAHSTYSQEGAKGGIAKAQDFHPPRTGAFNN